MKPMAILLFCILSFPMGLGAERRQFAGPDVQNLHEWFSLEIVVSNLPGEAAFVPVVHPVDFTRLLESAGFSGTVDERSLRLFHLSKEGEKEEAIQFSPHPQPRPGERKFLAGRQGNVSYLAEYDARDKIGPRVSGELAWIARPALSQLKESQSAEGEMKYRLEFAVLKEGYFIQVPYPPFNLRAMSKEGFATPNSSFPRMQARPQWPLRGMAQIFDYEKLVTSFHTGPDPAEEGALVRRPFFYPVHGPGDFPLTGFGKPHDPSGSHAHHYSIWIAHANVNGHDFWSEQGGIIAHEQFERMEDGPLFCRIRQRTRWIRGDSTHLMERREWTFHAMEAGFRTMDLALEFSGPGEEPVSLGQTSFGFLSVRVAPSISVFDGGGMIVNSAGQINEQHAHLRPADWIDQSGPVAPGAKGGIAILNHPQNPGGPLHWHCRNDGWASASFNARGAYTIEPGELLRLKYRLVLHRGNPEEIKVRYLEWIAEPVVRLGTVQKGPETSPE